MSNPRDDESISIEADAPEADWVDEQRPVSAEDDAEAYPSEARADDADISIESDIPEADWIEQHRPLLEAPVEEYLSSHDLPQEVMDPDAFEHDWITTDRDVGAADDQDAPTPGAVPGADGCNIVAAIAHAAVRQGCAAARQLERRNRRPPG